MRVAVHFAAGHPLARGDGPDLEPHDGPAVVAYKLGRIEDGVHNAPIGHEQIPLEDFIRALLKQAQAEYPHHLVTQDETVENRISVERLVRDGDEGRWIPADQFDPERHEAVGPGQQITRELGVTQSGEGAQ